MKRSLTLEALAEPPGAALLHQVTTLLRQYQLEPEIFVWNSTPPGNLVTMHLSLRPEDGRWMPAITDLLKENPAVHRVTPCDLNDFRSVLSRTLQTTVHRTPG